VNRIKIILITSCVLSIIFLFPPISFSETIKVLIKGIDDGVRTNKQQDFKEAEMNAKLQAIERAGVEISSITKVVNFQLKYDMIKTKAEAILLPGFEVMDMGYQVDGSYQIVLSGKIQTGGAMTKREESFKTLITKGHSALETGQLNSAKDFGRKAMEIPGFENNKDALWLIKLAKQEIMRRESEKIIFSGENLSINGKYVDAGYNNFIKGTRLFKNNDDNDVWVRLHVTIKGNPGNVADPGLDYAELSQDHFFGETVCLLTIETKDAEETLKIPYAKNYIDYKVKVGNVNFSMRAKLNYGEKIENARVVDTYGRDTGERSMLAIYRAVGAKIKSLRIERNDLGYY